MHKAPKRGKKKKSWEGGGDPKPRKQREGGRGIKRNAVLLEHHTNRASSTTPTKRKHMARTCPKATYHWTGICPHAQEQW